MAEVINLQEVLDALAATGADVDSLLTAVGETSSIPAGGFSSPVNVPYTLQSANGTNLANGVNAARSVEIADNVINIGNSNVQGGLSGFNSSYGASAGAGTGAGTSTLQSGGELFKNGASVGRTTSLLGTAASSIGLVATGLATGKTFAGIAYNLGHIMGFVEEGSALNPETWDSITYDMADTGLEGIYKRAFQMLICPDNTTGKLQAYMPEDTFDFMAWCLARGGAYSSGGYEPKPVTPSEQIVLTQRGDVMATIAKAVSDRGLPNANFNNIMTAYMNDPDCYKSNTICLASGSDSYFGSYITGVFIPDTDVTIGNTYTVGSNGSIGRSTKPSGVRYNTFTIATKHIGSASGSTNTPNIYAGLYINGAVYTLGNLYGTTTSPVEGVGTQPGATTPNLSPNDTLQQVKDKLRAQYPELHDNRIEMPVAEPATVPKPVTYIPVPLPSQVYENMPTSEPDVNVQSDPSIDPQTASDPLSALLLKLLTNRQAVNMPDPATDPEQYPEGKPEENPETNLPDVGTGTTPPLVVPVGSASALWTVYNPSMSEINALGAWLWSSNFIDQLLKMFSDPMQAIIGVHKVFASPAVSGRSNIVVGYLDSGVAANVVGSQYTTINCGTVKLSEYFGNVFDYSPHTKVSLFLPFIGVVDLDVGEVMRANISVIYHVDVFSGACLAEVNVTRDGAAGGVLYTFSGDAAVRYPLSSGSYMGMVSGVLSVVGGIAGTIASGGSLAPALLGGAVGLGNAHTTVQHSGSISGNAGAMGGKKPYLIIRRPQTAMANNYEHYSGVGANQRVTVFQMDGYFRLEDIRNVNIKGATDTEIEEIVRALEEGVLM